MDPNDIAKILDELGQRLGPAGNHIFEITVRQTYINAWTQVIIAVVSTIILIVWLSHLSSRFVDNWNTDILPPSEVAWTVAHTVVFVALVVITLISVGVVLFGGTIGALLNPEYAAMETLLNLIRK